MATCALCKLARPLRKSHIIPEFIYKPLYETPHRYLMLAKGKRPEYKQQGVKEHLLCEDCEHNFNEYEAYVSRVFNLDVPIQARREGSFIHVSGIDYRRFKLFGLSVLWRAGVASDPIFSKVALGPHEERLRHQLYNGDPGPSWRYAMFLTALEDDEIDHKGLIMSPTKSTLLSHTCYLFVFAGLIWGFVVSSHAPPSALRDIFIKEDGSLSINVRSLLDTGSIKRGLERILSHHNDSPA